MSKKVYVGGALFSEGEIAQRKKEANQLRENNNLEVYNPIESPINDKSDLPYAEEIFIIDTTQIFESDFILAELNNKIDEGLVAELAIAWAWSMMKQDLQDIIKQNSKGSLHEALQDWIDQYPIKEIVVHASDIRIPTAQQYSGVTIPVGFNQYIIGMLQNSNAKVFTNSKDAIEYIKGQSDGKEEEDSNTSRETTKMEN